MTTIKWKDSRDAHIGGRLKSVYGYFTCQVLDAEDMIQATVGAEEKEKKVLVLQVSMLMVLNGREFSCTAGFGTKLKGIM